MIEGSASRRMVIGAGVAAGAAMLAPLVLRRAATPGDADGITVVTGGRTAFVDDPAELGRWTGMVGRPVRLGGSPGTIEAVELVAFRGNLPADVRQHPFTVRFAVDPAGAPVGDAVADIDAAIDGLSRLFVQRGENHAGKAILIALFA